MRFYSMWSPTEFNINLALMFSYKVSENLFKKDVKATEVCTCFYYDYITQKLATVETTLCL